MRAHAPRSPLTPSRCLSALALLCLVLAEAAAAPPPPRMVAFGDSLSDTGNAAVLLGGVLAEPPYEPVPRAPYAVSDGRFSDGRVWLERLAVRIDARKGAKAALTNPGRHTNYAVGSARAGQVGAASLSEQLGAFLADFSGEAPPDALYVLWFGGNDLRDALALIDEAVATNGPGAVADAVALAELTILMPAVEGVRQALETLHAAGARRALVVHAPDIALLPLLRARPEPIRTLASTLTAAFNERLRTAVDEFEASSEMTIVQFEVNDLLRRVAADPAAFGFENVTVPCLSFGTVDDPVCERPKDDFFWDALHPTRAAHRLIGDAAADCVTEGSPPSACYGADPLDAGAEAPRPRGAPRWASPRLRDLALCSGRAGGGRLETTVPAR